MSHGVLHGSVGAKVTLLEKEAKVGGNSAKATSGINGWGTRPQATEMIHDEERNFERDTFRSGKGGRLVRAHRFRALCCGLASSRCSAVLCCKQACACRAWSACCRPSRPMPSSGSRTRWASTSR